jgi:anti-anti-sigma factor
VTALLLSAAPGASLLDNGVALPPVSSQLPESPTGTLAGGDAQRKTLCIQGRGDWTRSAVFHDECAAAIDAGRAVMLDLTLCRHLDSTFLGTIHQLCRRAECAGVEFRLQGVAPPVEQLFEELGMRDAIDHMVPCKLPLPTNLKPLGAGDPDRLASAQLLLRAHAGLAALNARNAREFDPLVAQLRREISESG